MRLSGKQDEGDVVVRHGGKHIVLELKNVKSWTYGSLLGYLGESVAETAHYAARRFLWPETVTGAVVLKVHRRPWEEAAVMMPMSEYLTLIGDADG